MIDEKKLIEYLVDTYCSDCSKCHRICRHDELFKIIDRQPKVNNWISCSKKMPDGCSDAEIEVIVQTHEPYSETVIDDSGFALYYPGTNKFHSVYGDRLDITEYVVAYQPLPTPYNAKRGGKNET